MEGSTELEKIDHLPGTIWARLRAEPERAPEIISLAAAERFGPHAAKWVATHQAHHQPADLARLAVKRHVRMASLEGGALGLGGVVTTAPDLVALVTLQARMVFFIAAAMGYDPNHPMRPAELLALQGVYETPADARRGLDGVGQSMAVAMMQTRMNRKTGRADRRAADQVREQADGQALRGALDPAGRRAAGRHREPRIHQGAGAAHPGLLRRGPVYTGRAAPRTVCPSLERQNLITSPICRGEVQPLRSESGIASRLAAVSIIEGRIALALRPSLP